MNYLYIALPINQIQLILVKLIFAYMKVAKCYCTAFSYFELALFCKKPDIITKTFKIDIFGYEITS